jgi:phosphatidylethanolamine-binding protein (PEBP) family uncharacterized protein
VEDQLKNVYSLAVAALCGLSLLSLAGCTASAQTIPTSSTTIATPVTSTPVTSTPTGSSFTLSSEAFIDGGLMGAQFTCDGTGVSPALVWKNAPAGTTSYAITMHHLPPANEAKHVYMLIYDLPASSDHLEQASTIGSWGMNTVNGKLEYTPPCSKGPGRKEYILSVYALSAAPAFSKSKSEIGMDDLLTAIKSTTLATATMTIGYARP